MPNPLCDKEEMFHSFTLCRMLSSRLQGIITFTLLKKSVNICFNHYLIIIVPKLKAILEGNELNGPKQDVTQCRSSVSNLMHFRTYLIKASLSPFQGHTGLTKRRFPLFCEIILFEKDLILQLPGAIDSTQRQAKNKDKERQHSMI